MIAFIEQIKEELKKEHTSKDILVIVRSNIYMTVKEYFALFDEL